MHWRSSRLLHTNLCNLQRLKILFTNRKTVEMGKRKGQKNHSQTNVNIFLPVVGNRQSNCLPFPIVVFLWERCWEDWRVLTEKKWFCSDELLIELGPCNDILDIGQTHPKVLAFLSSSYLWAKAQNGYQIGLFPVAALCFSSSGGNGDSHQCCS